MKRSVALFLLAAASLMLSFLAKCEAQNDVSALSSGGNDTDMKPDGKEKESKVFLLQNYETDLDMMIDEDRGEKKKEYEIRYDGVDFDVNTIGKESESEEYLAANNETDTHTKKDVSVYRGNRVKRQSSGWYGQYQVSGGSGRPGGRTGKYNCKCVCRPVSGGSRPRPSGALQSSYCYPSAYSQVMCRIKPGCQWRPRPRPRPRPQPKPQPGSYQIIQRPPQYRPRPPQFPPRPPQFPPRPPQFPPRPPQYRQKPPQFPPRPPQFPPRPHPSFLCPPFRPKPRPNNPFKLVSPC